MLGVVLALQRLWPFAGSFVGRQRQRRPTGQSIGLLARVTSHTVARTSSINSQEHGLNHSSRRPRSNCWRARACARVFLGQPAGCVTLKPVDQNRCELKRLYVRPTFRGHNLGKQLVDAFTQTARTLGFQYAVLDSHKSMTAAHDIYKNSGFKVVKSPPDFPEALKQSVIFMRCVL